MGKNYGTIRFYNARASGIARISHLGSGAYDHLGFFGAQGPTSAVEVEKYQDSTVIVNSLGSSPSVFGGSGYCTNCKYINTSTVQISGLPKGPYVKNINQVNVFSTWNLTHEPWFRNIPSGTLLIRYDASGVAAVRTYNAKLFAYKATGALTDAPQDVTVLGFEINASGKFKDSSHSGVWKQMHGQNSPMQFVDHSVAQGYRSRNVHIWVAAITVKPTAIGILDNWNLCFQMQYA